jgi:hypothetical protein
MAEGTRQGRFAEAVLLELAEALALGEPVPERLASAWEAIGSDPEALGRVEGLRAWWLAMREGAAAGAAGPALVLRLDRSRGLRIEVLHAAASLVPVLTTRMDGSLETRTVVGRTVHFQDLKLSIEDGGDGITVRVQGRRGGAGVWVDALDSRGAPLARATTDAEGVARLEVGRATRLSLSLSFHEGRPSGEDQEI